MIIKDILIEAETIIKMETIKSITNNTVDDIINLIKHRKRKPEKKEKEILIALKQGGIIDEIG